MARAASPNAENIWGPQGRGLRAALGTEQPLEVTAASAHLKESWPPRGWTWRGCSSGHSLRRVSTASAPGCGKEPPETELILPREIRDSPLPLSTFLYSSLCHSSRFSHSGSEKPAALLSNPSGACKRRGHKLSTRSGLGRPLCCAHSTRERKLLHFYLFFTATIDEALKGEKKSCLGEL